MNTIKNAGTALLCLLAIIGLVAIVMYFAGGKPDISPYERENIILKREADSLQNIVRWLKLESTAHYTLIDSLYSSLDSLNSLQSLNRLKHENEIARIIAIDDGDELYRLFTEYIGK